MDFNQEGDKQKEPAAHSANPGYILGQLAKAYTTTQTHEDPATRARAAKKVERWLSVFQGMLSGLLKIGSRTPIAGVPAWATLDVAKGGFATGTLLAGGDIQTHETALLEKLPAFECAERAAINSYYLSEQGFHDLEQMLLNGTYRIRIPEEGALLAVTWLVANGHADEARAVIDDIGPYLSDLRFYPIPDPHPIESKSTAYLQDVGETVRKLQAVRRSSRIEAEREAIEVWAPIYDRVVYLFVETIDGVAPYLSVGPDGQPMCRKIEGGWPCQRYPDDWCMRAQAVLDEYEQLRKQHAYCGKPENRRRNFAILRGYLRQCIEDPSKLTGLDVGRIRAILAAIAAKRGLPGSPRCQQLRDMQVKQMSRLTNVQWAQIITNRLMQLPQNEGLSSLDAVAYPLSDEEAGQFSGKGGCQLPKRSLEKIKYCLDAPLEKLVEMGVITSGETLAKLLPQFTSQIRATGIADGSLRRLYGAIYEAFRRRRSLLLLNLESQVKILELPWVKAIEPYRTDDQSVKKQATEMLRRTVELVIRAFPHQIIPNKLLQEIRSLGDSAGLRLPIVDELAADIFIGDFSENYLRAAQKAAEFLKGTLYERYYGIPYDRIQQIDDVEPSRYKTPISEGFGRLCCERAGETDTRGGWSVARNGKIIEQEQILTTHNLAVLFSELDLATSLGPELGQLARECFVWICRQQQMKITDYQSRLRMLKNTAYAWRQMVFFLSLLSADDVQDFLEWASDHLQKQREDYRDRFQPALDGLAIAAGSLLRANSVICEHDPDFTCFLGWTTTKHWLMP